MAERNIQFKLSVKTKEVEAQLKKLEKQLETLQGKMANTTFGSKQRGAISTEVNKTQKAINRLNNSMAKLNATAKGTGSIFLNITRYFTGLLLVTQVVKALRSGVNAFLDYNAVMQKNLALSYDISKSNEERIKEFETLKKQAIDLGKSTVYTSVQVGELQTSLIKLGFTVPQIENMSKAILDLSAALDTSLERTGTVVGSIARQFEIAEEGVVYVADLIAKASVKSANDLETLAASMKFAGSTASAVGLELKDTVAILNTLANIGIKGSIGGTALNNALIELNKNSSKAVKTFGFTVSSMEDMYKVLQIVRERGYGVGEMFDLMNIRSARAVIALSSQEQALHDMAGEMDNVTDSAKDMAAIQLDQLQGDITLLKSNLSALAIEGFNQTSDALRDMVQTFTGWVDSIREAGKWLLEHQVILDTIKLSIRAIIGYMVGVKIATTKWAISLNILWLQITKSNSALSQQLARLTLIRKAAGKTTFANTVLGRSFTVLTLKIKSMGAALKANPLGLIIAAVAILIPMITKLVTKNKELNDSFKEQSKEITDHQKKVNDLVKELQQYNLDADKKKELFEELLKLQPEILDGIDTEGDYTKTLWENLKLYNEETIKQLANEELKLGWAKKNRRSSELENKFIEAQSKGLSELQEVEAEYALEGDGLTDKQIEAFTKLKDIMAGANIDTGLVTMEFVKLRAEFVETGVLTQEMATKMSSGMGTSFAKMYDAFNKYSAYNRRNFDELEKYRKSKEIADKEEAERLAAEADKIASDKSSSGLSQEVLDELELMKAREEAAKKQLKSVEIVTRMELKRFKFEKDAIAQLEKANEALLDRADEIKLKEIPKKEAELEEAKVKTLKYKAQEAKAIKEINLQVIEDYRLANKLALEEELKVGLANGKLVYQQKMDLKRKIDLALLKNEQDYQEKKLKIELDSLKATTDEELLKIKWKKDGYDLDIKLNESRSLRIVSQQKIQLESLRILHEQELLAIKKKYIEQNELEQAKLKVNIGYAEEYKRMIKKLTDDELRETNASNDQYLKDQEQIYYESNRRIIMDNITLQKELSQSRINSGVEATGDVITDPDTGKETVKTKKISRKDKKADIAKYEELQYKERLDNLDEFIKEQKVRSLDGDKDELAILKTAEELRTQILAEEVQKRKDIRLEEVEQTLEMVQQGMSALSDIMATIKEGEEMQMEAMYERREESLQSTYDNQLKALGLYNKDSSELTAAENRRLNEINKKKAEDDKALEEEKGEATIALKKKYADKEFAMQVAQIISSTALGIMSIWSTAGQAGLGAPVYGAIMTALIGGLGLTQIANANKQRNIVKSLGDGGFIDGNSHNQGGELFSIKGGGQVELEGKEFVVNKTTMANPIYRDAILQMNDAGVKNKSFNSGVFADGGTLPSPTNQTDTTGMSEDMIRMIVQETVSGIAQIPVVNNALDTGDVINNYRNVKNSITV